jgi:hypothetical protein
MSHIIQKFGDWKKLNENDLPGRERERGDKNNKIVAIPVDKSTLKLKIVNDADVIDGNGRMTIDGFDALLAWIQSQGEIISYYSALKDLTNNVVVYEVGKDNDRKQVVIFKIYNKNALKMQDPSQPGINSQVRFVSSKELGQALGGAILNTKAIANIVSGQTKGPGGTNSVVAGFKLPYPIASMMDSTDPKLISFVILAYNKILSEPRAKTAPIMVKVRAEAGAKKLGPASQVFIKALNAGFSIQDNEFAGEIEDNEITQILVDKISYTAESKGFYLDLSATRIVESESDVIRGFDVDLFLAAAKNVPGIVSTGDIKVPEEGFKYGSKGDVEFGKFQQVLLDNLKTYQGGALKAKAPVAAFLKTTADKIYGDKTKNLIAYLKIGLTDPKYPDNDATTIKPDFVNRMMKEFKLVKESRTYLGLDGVTVIMEGFDTGAADTATGGGGGGGQRVVVKNNNNAVVSSKDIYEIEGKEPNQYKVISKVWNTRYGAKAAWGVLLNPTSVARLQRENPDAGGNFIKLIKNSKGTWEQSGTKLYRFTSAKTWEVFINGKWTASSDASFLTTAYGTNPMDAKLNATGAPKAVVTATGATTADVDKDLTDLGNAIETFVEGGHFSAYKSWSLNGGDNEDGAWDEVLYPEWSNNWKNTLDKIEKKVKDSTSIKEADKTRYNTSIANIKKMFVKTSFNTVGTFYRTFQGSESYDDYDLKLLLSGSQVKKINIECDF